MEQNQLSQLFQLVKNLDENEIEQIRRDLKENYLGTGANSKLQYFFEDLLCSEHYPQKVADRERKLGEMLEKRILDCSIQDRLLTGVQDPSFSEIIYLEKTLLHARIMMAREVYQRSEQYLSRCIRKAKVREDYDLALRAQRLLVSLTSLQKDSARFTKHFQAIDDLEYLNHQKNRAIRMFQELRIRKQRNISENINLYLNSAYQKLEDSSQKVECKTIDFIKFYFLKEKFEQEGDPFSALRLVEKLQNLSQTAINSYLISNELDLLFELARLLFSSGNVWNAEYFLKKCIEGLNPKNHNYHRALELLLFLYHHQDLTLARDQIIKIHLPALLQSGHLNPDDHCKWLYYRACLSLSVGEAHSCHRDIDRIYHIEKPNDTLNMHLRMLRIISYIECELYDHADRDLEASHKFIRRKKLEQLMEKQQLAAPFKNLLVWKKKGYARNSIPLEAIRYQPRNLHYTLFNYAAWFAKMQNKQSHNLCYLENRRETSFNEGKVLPIFL